MPGVPEALVSGRPIVVRNLTRAPSTRFTHALDAHEVERLRRGGLLAEIVGARGPLAEAVA